MRVGSMCSGGGGLELAVGMLWPDAELAWVAENDRHAALLLEARFPGVPNLGDLKAADWTQVEPVDVVTAGFPCQDLSYAGRGAGIVEGSRSGLWYVIARALGVLRPRLVLLENVAAIVGRRPGLDVVLASLAEFGFDAEWRCLRASDVGAPHRRERWFAVAHPGSAGAGRDARSLPRPAAGARRQGVDVRAARDGGPAAADAGGDRLGRVAQPDVRPQRPGVSASRRGDAERLDAAAPDADGEVGRRLRARSGPGPLPRPEIAVDWLDYAPAIERWAAILGRPAPPPTDDRGRLSPPFVEWMMGWPQGWVDGLSRTRALKVLGNGVVVQQAVAAYSLLLERLEAREVAA